MMQQFAPRNTFNTRRGGFLQGCLIVVAIILAIIGGLSIFVAYNWRGWVATGVKESTTAILADSSLAQADKDQISAKVETLAKDFESGKLTMIQMGKIAEALVASPILPAAIVSAVESSTSRKRNSPRKRPPMQRLCFSDVRAASAKGRSVRIAFERSSARSPKWPTRIRSA